MCKDRYSAKDFAPRPASSLRKLEAMAETLEADDLAALVEPGYIALDERDWFFLQFCRQSDLSALFVPAGSYQAPTQARVIPVHLNTFKAAAQRTSQE